ncbi:MAG: 4-hydroxy-3-methylbut-2-enyl diphosphate reductase [Puniceicoccales bacterium]|nr:4-hydroxy-3-methylbut-2-enyl diphosphate reductase [Puniceicoccales bacterium]
MLEAKILGFCGGVRRAIALAHGAISDISGRVYADGELVHNGRVMDDLRSSGLKLLTAGDFEKIAEHDCVITRAHGTPKWRREMLRGIFKNVIDGTCPHVAGVCKIVAKAASDGKCILIIGNENHPEVVALRDAANGGICKVLCSADDVQSLERDIPAVLVVAQSTICERFFVEMSAKITAIFTDAEVRNTICTSSRARQNTLLELKKGGAEAIVIVGGKHSNNSATLVAVAEECALPVFLVECAHQLPLPQLETFQTVGVASGASTDRAAVDEVIAALKALR